jgi:hypothetical protein
MLHFICLCKAEGVFQWKAAQVINQTLIACKPIGMIQESTPVRTAVFASFAAIPAAIAAEVQRLPEIVQRWASSSRSGSMIELTLTTHF